MKNSRKKKGSPRLSRLQTYLRTRVAHGTKDALLKITILILILGAIFAAELLVTDEMLHSLSGLFRASAPAVAWDSDAAVIENCQLCIQANQPERALNLVEAHLKRLPERHAAEFLASAISEQGLRSIRRQLEEMKIALFERTTGVELEKYPARKVPAAFVTHP